MKEKVVYVVTAGFDVKAVFDARELAQHLIDTTPSSEDAYVMLIEEFILNAYPAQPDNAING